jgi:biopolymer transport protein ExbB
VLDYEIEEWNEAGTSSAWVRVPQIDGSSSNDFIWMYYGNGSAVDASTTAVWSADYQGVWHLNEATGVAAVDATANTNDATPVNDPTASAGKISGGLTFASTSELDIAAHPSLDLSTYSDWTISAWVKPTSYTGTAWPIVYSYGSFGASLGLTVAEGTDGLIENWTNDSALLQSNTAVTLNEWNYIAISRNATTTTFYLNGAAVGSGASTTISTSGQTSHIGNNGGFASDQFLGLIDEVHVTSAARSADWVQAEYLSTSNAFAGLTGEESLQSAGVLANDTDVDAAR